ncbi:MAG: hypothetical protein AB9846_07455 [Tenuifilaceae bacterium]
MKRTNLFLAASLLMAATVFTSCEKAETTDPMVEISQDDDQVTALYDDVLTEADDLTLASDGVMKAPADFDITSGSGTRTVVTTFEGDWMVKTITFTDFVNSHSENGHIKNGKIIIKMLGRPFQATFERVITFNNFTIDGVLIEGEKRITKTAQYQYTITLTGGKVTFTDGTAYTRESSRIRTWEEGYDTPALLDNVFTVTGTSTGVNRQGLTYTHTITNALVFKVACRWIVEGTVESVCADNTVTLDYGTGECDNLATMTLNGVTTEITLRGKR